ncbi:hypothetical protein [Reyranella sp. CPCC 100927]|uniref:hypothetical protein n=1 Tax=Reyranella sp. CPCC 100927 TaxID=2599616 RepID=UPI0011B77992|nr:hypothetical protein [Reyranella sp. CPCC 100927]TWT02591.1 hypothetical protein FQU96_30205 [Reyranella sp. CPCC 100927]
MAFKFSAQIGFFAFMGMHAEYDRIVALTVDGTGSDGSDGVRPVKEEAEAMRDELAAGRAPIAGATTCFEGAPPAGRASPGL